MTCQVGSRPSPLPIHPPGAADSGQSPQGLPPRLCPSLLLQPWENQARAGHWVLTVLGLGISSLGSCCQCQASVAMWGAMRIPWCPSHLGINSLLEMLTQSASFLWNLKSSPTMPLGLQQVSRAPRPLLPSPSIETPPRVDRLASPGPATQHEQPGSPSGQAILKAKEQLQEGTSTEPMAAHLCPGATGAQVLACLPPAQDPSLAWLPPQ